MKIALVHEILLNYYRKLLHKAQEKDLIFRRISMDYSQKLFSVLNFDKILPEMK